VGEGSLAAGDEVAEGDGAAVSAGVVIGDGVAEVVAGKVAAPLLVSEGGEPIDDGAGAAAQPTTSIVTSTALECLSRVKPLIDLPSHGCLIPL